MILDGSTYYMTFDINRFVGMFLALIATILVETIIIERVNRRKPIKNIDTWLLLMSAVNVLTFFIGMFMFVLGV